MLSFAPISLGQPRRRGRTLPRTASLLYSSNGDTNGVFYFFGTNYGAEVWSNPYIRGMVGFTPVLNAKFNTGTTDLPENYTNRSAATHVDLSGTAPIAYIIDLRVGNSLVLTTFLYRYRPDSTSFTPTAWTVEGSNDLTNWTLVLTVTGATPSLSGWVASNTSGQSVAYRWFRVKQTAADNTGFFTTGQIELYGSFARIPK